MEFEQAVFPQKDIAELLEWLQEKYVVSEIKLADFSKSFGKHLVYNAVHAVTNQKLMLEERELQFICYRVEKAAHNSEYDYILESTYGEYIYVIIEKNTGYILSNCNKLYLELVIARGVTKEDIDNNTMYMQYYLDCLRLRQEEMD
ncbi:hypothetical protein D1159_11770 [Pseudoflavonifractor sp. 524-17]|nr:hypothetical protein [Pseudoflavonifractor sp. 524-17]